MKLGDSEYTIQSLIIFLNEKFGSKKSGKPFNNSDIAQYERRGYLPYRYGGDKIIATDSMGVKLLKLKEDENLKNKVK